MKQTDDSLKINRKSSKLATTSLLNGIAAWGCLLIANWLLNLFVVEAMAQRGPETGKVSILVWLPLILFFGLVLILPGIAIIKGVQANKRIDKNGVDRKWQAWVGIILGALLYLTVLIIFVYISAT